MTLPVDYANATVSLDTHPDAHNATNAAVNDLDGRVSDVETAAGVTVVDTANYFVATDVEGALAELGSAASTSSTILSGGGVPSTGLGTVGDYYLDTANHVLYGPKGTLSPAAEQFTYTGTAVSHAQDWEFGAKVTFTAAGTVTGIRYQRTALSTAILQFRAWDSGGTKVADTTDSRSGQVGDFTVALPTPLTVAASSTYTFSVGHPTGNVPYKSGAASPTNTASMTFVGFFSVNDADVYPTGTGLSATFYVGPVFQGDTAPNWPVAVYGIPPGGTTNQFLKKTSATDYAVAWVT